MAKGIFRNPGWPQQPPRSIVPYLTVAANNLAANLQPLYDWDPAQDRWIIVGWYQPDADDTLGIPPFAPSSATVAQQAGLFGWDPQHDLWLPQRWFSPEHDAADGPLTGKRATSSAYRSLVIADGAASYWRLNEPDNDLTPDPSDWYTSYDEVNAREGMWTGGITNGRPSLLTGDPTDNAIALDGTAKMTVLLANWFQVALADFTVEAWFRTSSATSQTIAAHKNTNAAGTAGWWLEVTGAGTPGVFLADGVTQISAQAATSGWNDGNVHHLMAVRQGSNLTLYLDARLPVTTAGANLDATNAQPFTIGELGNSLAPFNGDLDEIAVYTSALTQAQFTNHDVIGRQLFAPTIELDDFTEQHSWNIAWFQPDDDYADLVPHVAAATPVNQQPLYDWDAQRDLWLPARWYQDPDDELGFPLPLEPLGSPVQPLYDWDGSQDRPLTIRWFQPDGDGTLGGPPFAITSATVAQQPTNDWDGSLDRWLPIIWYQPEDGYESPLPIVADARPDQRPLYDWDPQQDNVPPIRWFQPDADDAFGSPIASAINAGLFGWDAGLDQWLPIRWYQEPDDQLGIPPFAATSATTAQEPLYDWDGSQDRALVAVWFQPDDPWDGNFQFQQITTATVPQQPLYQLDAPDLWLPVRWYQEPDDSLGMPPFAATSATVAQQPLYDWAANLDRWQPITWIGPDDDFGGFVPITTVVTVATVPQQAGLWQEQPYPEAGNAARWFQPDVDEARGITPFGASTFTTAQGAGLFIWDPALDQWLPPRWYQEPDDALGLVPQNLSSASVDRQPLYDWDAGQDRWSPIAWSQEGHLTLDFALPTAATVAQEAGFFADPRLDLWAPVRWFSPDDDETGFFQAVTTTATVAQQPLYDYDPQQDEELRARWFDLPDDAFVPFVQTVNTYSVSDYDPQQDRPSSIRWYQEPDDTVGLYPTTAQAAQNVGGYDPSQDVSTAQSWPQPDADTLGIPPFSATSPTVAQLAALFGSDPQQERSLQPVWFQPDDDSLGTLFAPVGFAANQTPAFDYDPQQDRLTAPRWFHPEDDASGIATTSSTTAQQVIQGEFPEVPTDQHWFVPADDTNGTPFGINTPTVAQLAAILGDETHQQDRSLQPVWYQEPDPALGRVSGIFAGPPGPPYVRISNAGPSMTASDSSRQLAVANAGPLATASDAAARTVASDSSPHVDVEDHLGQ